MKRTRIAVLVQGLLLAVLCLLSNGVARCADDLEGFYIGGGEEPAPYRTQGIGWTSSSSGSSTLGAPATLTWSVVPDNTQMPTGLGEPISNSSLIEFLDGVHHAGDSPGGSDLTQRAWWQLMNSAFERWDAVSGLTFNYESNDDGQKLGTSSGALGARGDIRIGGHPIDGQTSPTFLAYSFFPNNADLVIDTDEINRWSNSSDDYLLFRNMLMHEIGHGIGLNHVESFDVNPDQEKFQFGTFLMEPILSSAYQGPQYDDILGAHRLYGDRYEEGSGNNTSNTATVLGPVSFEQSISIGTDAGDTYVDFDDVDFVSIDDNSDVDYFRFTLESPRRISIYLTPMGPTYPEGPQNSGNSGSQLTLDGSAQNDLSLSLIAPDGFSPLVTVDETTWGMSEVIEDFYLPLSGDYFIRVGGSSDAAQFFQLDVYAIPEPGSAMLLALGAILLGGRRRGSLR